MFELENETFAIFDGLLDNLVRNMKNAQGSLINIVLWFGFPI